MPYAAPKQISLPDAAPPTGAYSPGVLCDGWLFVSGQGPLDPETGAIVRRGVAADTRLVLARIEAVLRAAGAGLDDVVKCTCHLADIDEFSAFDAAYAACFPGRKPARTTVQSILPGGISVEIDAIARVPGAAT